MKKNKLFIIAGLAAALSGVAAGCGGTADKAQEKSTKVSETIQGTDQKEADTEPAGMFTNLDTTDMDGNEVTVRDFESSRLTMINVWATWCGPCANEIPDLAELAKEYEKDGEISIKGLLVETNPKTGELVIGLSDSERDTAETILDNSGAKYQQLLVSESMTELMYQIAAFPTTYFVDQNGNTVGEEVVGARSGEEWKEIIQERLDMVKDE